MITDDHFDALRKVREEAVNLRAVCIDVAGSASLIHMTFDPLVSLRPTKGQRSALNKLRLIQ